MLLLLLLFSEQASVWGSHVKPQSPRSFLHAAMTPSYEATHWRRSGSNSVPWPQYWLGWPVWPDAALGEGAPPRPVEPAPQPVGEDDPTEPESEEPELAAEPDPEGVDPTEPESEEPEPTEPEPAEPEPAEPEPASVQDLQHFEINHPAGAPKLDTR